MKKYSLLFFSGAIFFLFSTNLTFAEDYVFPHPKGVIHNINGYGGSDTHLNKYYYSLDFRPYDEGGNRCNSYGAPVLASKAGTVNHVDKTGTRADVPGYGNWAIIQNTDGTFARYAHMITGTVIVNKGDTIKQGQILGLLGDTGYTRGAECQAYDGVNIGAHLHFENRDKDNNSLAPEPLVGEDSYTNIVETTYGERGKIVDGRYISTTLMYDPTGHWAKYAGKVPYRLTYNPTRIASFGPLAAEGGKEQVFTIAGENLFGNLKVTLPGCKGGIKWLKKEGDEQRFSCTFAKPKQSETRPGFIEFGAEKIHFQIEVLPDSTLPTPVITKAQAIKPLAGKMTDFIVEGQHLPGDLSLDGFDCEETALKSISPKKQEFSCRLPAGIYEAGRWLNGIHTFQSQLSSSERSYKYSFSFSADYEVNVYKEKPDIAHAGEKTLFSFAGKNLHLIGAMWVENCQNLREVGRTDEKLRLECTFPTEGEELYMSLLTPNIFKQNKYKILLKDKPGGTTLFEERISVFYYKNPFSIGRQTDEKSYSQLQEGGGMREVVPTDNEAMIEYFIEANGKYDNALLKEVGWQNVGTAEEPVYRLTDCAKKLKDLGRQDTSLKLNTDGACAQGLNSLFLSD